VSVLNFRTVVADEHFRFRGSVIGKTGAVARGRCVESGECGEERGEWRGGDDDDSDEEEALGRSALPMWRERAGAKNG
jgi:hypothetical protein